MSQTPHDAEIEDRAAAELSATVRNSLLTHVRSMETPWSKLTQDEQQMKIDAVERIAEDAIRKAVGIISRRGFETLNVRIKDFTVKDGAIKGKFEALVTEDNVVMLGDHQSKVALIVLAEAEEYIGGTPAKADPDEPGLPIDGEDE